MELILMMSRQESNTHHWWSPSEGGCWEDSCIPEIPQELPAVDIGCGNMAPTWELLESEGLFKGVGWTAHSIALSLAKKKVNFVLVAGDTNNLPIRTNSIGLIIAMDILEHLEDDSKGIDEFQSRTQEGGILLLTVPAFEFLMGIQDRVTGHKDATQGTRFWSN